MIDWISSSLSVATSSGYRTVFTPKLYPCQLLEARLDLTDNAYSKEINVQLGICTGDTEDTPRLLLGSMTVPDTGIEAIAPIQIGPYYHAALAPILYPGQVLAIKIDKSAGGFDIFIGTRTRVTVNYVVK